MFQIDFRHPVNVHFIGIGGISMSGLASVLVNAGFHVSGSDAKESPLTQMLGRQGVDIRIGQRAENIDPSCELVVYTAAIHPDNPEFAAAAASGVPMLTRAQLLGEIMANYPQSVAVAGTHGKTTTTSMISHITLEADLDPTISVGGILKAIHGNIRTGQSPVFVTEACEYTNSFLSLRPYIGIILNIDADHLDFFKDLDDIRHSFHEFALLVPASGTLVLSGQIPRLDEFTQDLACRVVTFGEENSTYHPAQIAFDENGCPSFDVYKEDTLIGHFSLRVPGMHNVLNACAAIAACDALQVPVPAMQKGLLSFEGADRRFEHKGTQQQITVIDDYAHHPTEITATLKAVGRFPHRSVWCVFQPHTYTRTKALLGQFAEALSLADHVVLADIYAAREVNTIGITSDDLRKELEKLGTDTVYLPSFAQIGEWLLAHVQPGDLVLTMGAGDIYRVGEDLLSTLSTVSTT